MAKQAKKRSGKKRGGSADAGVNVRLGTAIKAVRAASATLRAKKAKAADREAVERFIDAARAFLVVWKCQDKVMSRRF